MKEQKENFKDAAWIVKLFNHCIAKGKEYLDAKELDDDPNMYLSLMDFGKELGSLSEITVRHLLYMYDRYEEPDETCSNFYDLWRRLCNGSLQPQLKQLGFPCNPERKSMIEKFDVRNRISNRPKHRGELVDPSEWQICHDFYEELRRLIWNFIASEKTDSLEALHARTGNSEEEELSALFDDAKGFRPDSGYRYILVTNRIRYKNVLGLFKIPWSIILDFDEDTNEPEGLSYKFQHTQMDTLAEWYSLNERVKKSSTAIHWVNIAIKDGDGERYADRALALKASKGLRRFIESYHRKHAEPVMVIVSMSDESYARTLKSIANVIYELYENECALNNNDAKFFLLQGSSVELALEDERLLQTFDLGIRQLIDGVQKEIADKPVFTGQYLMPAKLEDGYSRTEMTKEQYLQLRQYADPIFLGIEQDASSGDAHFYSEDFYRGDTPVTWKMLATGGTAIIPDPFEDWKNKLDEYCSKLGTPLFRLYYKRGMGGTTSMRMLAFAMHEKYPTIIVHSYTPKSTAEEIKKLYTLCNMPLLIFVDTNQLYNEEVEKLRAELKSQTFSFVMVWLIGGTESLPRGPLRWLSTFSEVDQTHMIEALKKNIHSVKEIERLNKLETGKFPQAGTDVLSPFLLSMYVFEEDFPGIRRYVENTLKFSDFGEAQRQQIPMWENVLFAVALASWAGFPVDEQSLAGLNYPGVINRLKQRNSPLAPLVSFEKSKDHGFFKIRHYQFSTYILGYFSGGDGKNIRFTGLTDRIVQFIKDSRGDPSRLENEETIRLLRRLLINRDWDSSNITTRYDSNQQVYSMVIRKMIDDHKTERQMGGAKDAYDPETDGIRRIFLTLTKSYPEEIHFHAHLARYYFYTAHDYEGGLREIDEALNIAEEDPEKSRTEVALAYHIKGMGYRTMVYNNSIREIRKLLETLSKSGMEKAEVESRMEVYLAEMRQNTLLADNNFERSEEYGGDNSVYALISTCQLHIEIQRLYQDIIKKSAQYGLSKLVHNEDFVRNVDLLRSKNDELQACFDFFDDDIESGGLENEKAKKNRTLVQDVNADVVALTQLDEDAILFCQQCLSNGAILEKAHYRHLIAQIKFAAIHSNITTEENQQSLHEIICLYEENIAEKPDSRTDIRGWFNSIRWLNCDHDEALEILESCRQKLDRWIDSGRASRDAYLYRYIVRFLTDYESSSLSSSDSRRALKQMEEDIKIHADSIPTKTNVIFWIGRKGYGLNRLISNTDFYNFPVSRDIGVLQPMEGRLPERSEFAKNKAYIDMNGHQVFFRPTAVRGTVSTADSGAFVTCNIGFSYDGLRSYHDSIKRIVKEPIKREHFSGEEVVVRVCKHNSTWVECLIDCEDQPVIISKNSLPARFDPDSGKWPKQGEILDVILVGHRKYVLHGDVFDERGITKEPFTAECKEKK